MSTDAVIHIGPCGISFSEMLLDSLTRRGLREATLASAYLTDYGASWIIALLNSRSQGTAIPHVRLLIGSMNGFTRRSAIYSVLKESRKLRGRVRLTVMHPEEPHFHVKAFHAWFNRGHDAAVGSHNMTGQGLDSRGEFGLWLKGRSAKNIGQALNHWVKGSVPWDTFVRKYRERTLPESDFPPDPPGVKATAAPFNATGFASTSEQNMVDICRRTFQPLLKRCGDPSWLSETSVSDASKEGYMRGAYYDGAYYDDSSRPHIKKEDSWKNGQERIIRVVAQVLPVNRGRDSLIFPSKRQVIRYKVSPAIRRAAIRLGINEERPASEDMQKFMEVIRQAKKA